MPTSSHLLRWSTEMLPERERFCKLREEFARQNLALDVIDHSGGRPRIDVTGVLGMSRRYVQKLFEGTGKSFTEHLAGCRLERAFAMLTDPHHLHLAIIDIAFAVGFGDVSHFNRMFRRRFGETPSGVRAAATMREQKRFCDSSQCARRRRGNAGICGLRGHLSAT